MNYLKTNPGARRAYRARWADAWRRMLESGAASPDEEEATRREILMAEAGVESSSELTAATYTKVMLHLGMICGEVENKIRNPWRAKRIARIEHIAKALRPEDPESYIVGVLDDMRVVRDAAKWRTALTDDYLHNTMLTMVAQERRVKERGGVEETGSGGVEEKRSGGEGEKFTRGMTPAAQGEEVRA
jgi:hypothetical protein